MVAQAVQAELLIPCGVLAVTSTGHPMRVEAFSSQQGPAVSAASLFYLASLTKPILATAVLQLVERGLLSLAIPLHVYLPEFCGKEREAVTAWHLLTHTSGLPEIDWETALRAWPERAVSFEVACTVPLEFAPGQRIGYSTLSFFVLAELLERLGGQAYPTFLKEHIFTPLDMRETTFRPLKQGQQMVPIQGISAGTALDEQAATEVLISLALPGAGLWSTAGDLMRFGQACLSQHHVVSAATQQWMTRDHTGTRVPGGATPAPYGLGWHKSTLTGRWPGSSLVFEQDGAAGSWLWIDPETELVMVFLTSAFGTDGRVPQHVIGALYGI